MQQSKAIIYNNIIKQYSYLCICMYVWKYILFCSSASTSYPFDYRFYKCLQKYEREEWEREKIPDIPHYIHTIHIIHSTRGNGNYINFLLRCMIWWYDARCYHAIGGDWDRNDDDGGGGKVRWKCYIYIGINRDWKIWQRWSEKTSIVPYWSLSRPTLYRIQESSSVVCAHSRGTDIQMEDVKMDGGEIDKQ